MIECDDPFISVAFSLANPMSHGLMAEEIAGLLTIGVAFRITAPSTATFTIAPARVTAEWRAEGTGRERPDPNEVHLLRDLFPQSVDIVIQLSPPKGPE